MRYFPVFLDLAEAKVVVVGGGEEALRKVRLLLKTTARIEVVAPELHEELSANPRVMWLAKAYAAPLLDGARLVYSADPALNAQVSADAQARGIPVNAVDQAEISTFLVPSIVDRDPVVIAIGTEGTAPVLAMGLRARIDALLPARLGALAARGQTLRENIAGLVPQGNRRRAFWHEFFFGAPRDAFLSDDDVAFDLSLTDAIHGARTARAGRVSLVGAGPGDPELLTFKAQRILQEADVIVHDCRVAAAILETARRDAVRVEVSPHAQDIEAILVHEAKKGLKVVHLIQGNPDADASLLESAGIAVDVVPGIENGRAEAAILPFPIREDIRDAALRAAS
jgi:uroporphyrin-III C-methyltransferase / precorrin-2 dehydrogenase / sirohydrochlorin ferrochelatase